LQVDFMHKRLLFVAFLAFLLASCTREREKPHAAAAVGRSEAATGSIPRGITGAEVGMTPLQIGQIFTVREDQDPVAMLLKKYGKPAEAEAVSRQNKAVQERFFRISSGVGKLPGGVASADARATHDVVFAIGLHYDEASDKKIGWAGVAYPYVAKYGKPSEDTGTGYVWKDGRTRLSIEASGAQINVFFVDEALET